MKGGSTKTYWLLILHIFGKLRFNSYMSMYGMKESAIPHLEDCKKSYLFKMRWQSPLGQCDSYLALLHTY